MKVLSVIALVYLSAVCAFPKAKPDVKDEVEIVPLEHQPYGGRGGVVTPDVFVSPSFGPFDGLFESLAGVMMRMRQQMDSILRRIHGNSNRGNSTDLEPGFGFNFPDVDLNKGNTTSVTKIIDGHKVVINETQYNQEGENGGSFFKVRIIDVQPSDTSVETTDKDVEEVTTNTNKQRESGENEISKYRENEASSFEHLETFDALDHTLGATGAKGSSVEYLDTIEDNSVDSVPHRTADLSRDTYVNTLLANKGAPTNPDAEVFSSVESTVPFVSSSRGPKFEKIINPR